MDEKLLTAVQCLILTNTNFSPKLETHLILNNESFPKKRVTESLSPWTGREQNTFLLKTLRFCFNGTKSLCSDQGNKISVYLTRDFLRKNFPYH